MVRDARKGFWRCRSRIELIARALLTVQEAIEIVDIAADAEHQLHHAKVDQMEAFLSLLAPLSHSLRFDLAR